MNGIVEDYLNGMTNKEIVKKYKVGNTRLYIELKKAGIKPCHQVDNSEKHKKAYELYEAGKTYSEIGKILGVCQSSVGNWIKAKYGDDVRSKFYHTEEEVNEFIDMYEYGYTLAEIARKYGYTNAVVRSAMLHRGYDFTNEAIRGVPVVALDKYGRLVKEYCSISEAGRNMYIQSSAMSRIVANKKEFGGYIWMTLKEFSKTF